jgi:hypothetical protein
MATLNIGGKRVTVGDEFLNLSPEDQESTVDEIASSLTQPNSYSASEVPGEAYSNFGENAKEIAGQVYERATDDPVGFGKDIVKTAIGTGQKIVGGVAGELGYGPEINSPDYKPYEYERTHADPMLQGMLQDWGWKEPTGAAQWEQIKRHVAEKPLQAVLDASIFAGPASPVFRAGRGAFNTVRKAVTPNPARPGAADAARVMDAEGVPLTAGQRTGSDNLRYKESELGGQRVTNVIDQQNERYTRAASRRIGEDTPHLDGQTMERAHDRIGGTIGDIATRNRVVIDQQAIRQANAAVTDYNNVVAHNSPHRAPLVDNVLNEINSLAAGSRIIPGARVQTMRSQLGAAIRSTADPAARHALYNLQRALDDALTRSVSGADAQALRTARRQYRNYLVLEDAMATGGAETASGVLTPARLEQAAAKGRNRRSYLHGENDFTGLAKAGKISLQKPPQSGTSPRRQARLLPTVIGGAVGGMFGMPVEGAVAAGGAALGAEAAQSLAGGLIMSRPVQAYLGNQGWPGRTRAGTVAGHVAAPIASASPRIAALQHAETVLGPDALKEAKKALPQELNAWVSTRSPEAARALAEALAKKVNRPDLVERIFTELSAGQ